MSDWTKLSVEKARAELYQNYQEAMAWEPQLMNPLSQNPQAPTLIERLRSLKPKGQNGDINSQNKTV